LEWNYYFEHDDTCYTKIIVNIGNKNRLLGIHFFGPNAGEVIYMIIFYIRLFKALQSHLKWVWLWKI